MQKGKIIKEIIGKVLEPEGFVFDKEIKIWGFIKEFKNSKGEIARQTVTFWTSRFEKKLYMDINCFSGGIYTYGLNQFVPGYTNDGLNYTTDEEFKQVIETYANILKEYGLDFLKKIEVPKRSDYFRQEEYYKLFNEHESIAQKFIKEQQIDMECVKIEDAVRLMKDMVLEKQEEPFEDCRELFLEMAAFYGRVVSKYNSCKWLMRDMKTHSICKLEIESKRKLSLSMLNEIHLAWKNGVDRLDSLVI